MWDADHSDDRGMRPLDCPERTAAVRRSALYLVVGAARSAPGACGKRRVNGLPSISSPRRSASHLVLSLDAADDHGVTQPLPLVSAIPTLRGHPRKAPQRDSHERRGTIRAHSEALAPASPCASTCELASPTGFEARRRGKPTSQPVGKTRKHALFSRGASGRRRR